MVVIDQSSKSRAMAVYASVFVIVETLEQPAVSRATKATRRPLLRRPKIEPEKLEQDLKGCHIDDTTFLVKDTGKNIVASCNNQQ